jgi:hypothetical protein
LGTIKNNTTMNLEKELLGEKRHLKYDKEKHCYRAWILDAECDAVELEFNSDEIIIHTKKITYLMLTPNEMDYILSLHEQAKEMLELDDDWDDDELEE